MHRLRLRLSLFSLLGFVLPMIAWATSVDRMSLEEMTQASSAIVHGTVLTATSHWNEDRSLIVTDVQFQVIESLKGNNKGVILVTQPGGQVGKVRVDVPGAVAFRPGEETVLFLGPERSGKAAVAGLSFGRFDVVPNEKTGRKEVRRLPLRGSYGPASAPRGQTQVTGRGRSSLSDFLDEVRRLAAGPTDTR